MSWRDLLESGSERVLPWFGSRRVHGQDRSWTLSGPKPPEHGWYLFSTTGGKSCSLASRKLQQPNQDWGMSQLLRFGYLVGDRFIRDDARVDPDPDKLIEQTTQAHCVELGLERFVRVCVALDREENLVFISQEFPVGPEEEVIEAYQDRAESVDNIAGVPPALDLAFRWASYQRLRHEERQRELQRIREEEEKKRAEEERMGQLMKDAGTAVGRRALAVRDFASAAREALRVSGAELLDTRPSRNKGEMVVQYRFRRKRLECVVERNSLRVVDAGVCLTDHATGVKGDTWFTLESLPGVIGEAIDRDVLVVWRHP